MADTGGFTNDFAYCGPKSYSVIDYLFTSPDLFPIIDKLTISSFSQYSDHGSLHVKITSQRNSFKHE